MGFALAIIFSPYYILGGRVYPIRHNPVALRLRDRKGHAILCIALNPQSGDSSGATLEVPSEALLHAQCSPFASKIHSKVNFLLICLQMCIFCSTFARFCITLSRSAIEAHRTRLASWKRPMPPLSPQIKNLRGPRESAPYAKRSFDRKGDKNIARGRRIYKSTTSTTLNQQHCARNNTTSAKGENIDNK